MYKLIPLSLVLLNLNLILAGHKHQKNESEKKIEGKEISSLFRRSVTCQFPTDKGLVAVQTSGKNAGWAMHDDQECTAGSWCPYACPPGQLMGQWDPSVTSYTYPGSQYGGLYCDENGDLQEERSGSYCYSGCGTVQVQNNLGQNSLWCQTVLPGNEEMLIPTNVVSGGKSTIAVPDQNYWAGTASHFYINPPGVSVDDGCKWGSTANDYGNWAPYVAGANQDSNKNTFVKIGWNPVYLEDTSPFKSKEPSFGLRITCDDESKCNGLPCEIDPSKTGVNGVSGSSSTGAGGGDFCVVTASDGATANIVVFDVSGSSTKKKREQHEHAQHKREVTRTVYTTVTKKV
ncbi:hypothetical protein WICMUC_000253 [Wickerhamomyces mucosus]|uniref:Uncharacterized protein n=1 Tax=Wickerhamomyces mucosus TaxID=1378264 RepID=A0A9P8Q0H6_9ASCO|nr:hypothetical protein WICMUC_000253 [Wickerhamomyces mucosus]